MPKELMNKGGPRVTVDPDLDDIPVGDALSPTGVITESVRLWRLPADTEGIRRGGPSRHPRAWWPPTGMSYPQEGRDRVDIRTKRNGAPVGG